MNERAKLIDTLALLEGQRVTVRRAAAHSRTQRRASGEIMTYALDGWMVREHPGGRIERLCPVEEFRAADFPYPGFAPPLPRQR